MGDRVHISDPLLMWSGGEDFIDARDVARANVAALDAPMSLVCLLIVFAVSPWLGVFALIGAVVQVWIAVRTERSSSRVVRPPGSGVPVPGA